MIPKWTELIGRQVVAIRGLKTRKNAKNIPIEYVLFDDKETILELGTQDGDYHDCSPRARELYLRKDRKFWALLINDDAYGDSNEDTFF